MTVIDKDLENIWIEEKEYQKLFLFDESDYRRIVKKEMKRFINKKLGELLISKDFQKINENDLLVSYNFNSLYPSAEGDKESTWPAIETAHPFKKHMNESVCKMFNSGKWDKLILSAFLTVKYQSPEILTFQQIPIKEKVAHPCEKY